MCILYPGKDQQNIHGDTAELEREIPPVIDPPVDDEGQTALLPYFAECHNHAAKKEKAVEFNTGFVFRFKRTHFYLPPDAFSQASFNLLSLALL